MMKRMIFKNMVILSFAVVFMVSVLICVMLYRHNFNTMKEQLKGMASFTASMLDNRTAEHINLSGSMYGINSRITIIAADGTVLYDNMSDIRNMENHLDRPEIKSALETGRGETVRMSGTIGKQTFYYAVKLNDGSILRLSFTADTVYSTYISMVPYILLIALVVTAISMVMADNQSKQLVAPINSINFDKPTENIIYDELSPLLLRINYLKNHLDKQVSEAKEHQKKFEIITDNMSEGLIILDRKGHILSINPSAVSLLGSPGGEYTGRSILTLNRSFGFQQIIDKVFRGNSSEDTILKNERNIRIWANPVLKDGEIHGAIMILQDVTETQMAEDFRREFSANVSHELKSPLTVITGYAELMKNNMVDGDNIPKFAERIYAEAKRLLKLVEDIIVISRLDEGKSNLDIEEINLFEVCENVARRLNEPAAKKGVTVTVTGEPVTIKGVFRLIEELVYNLCDNAINYNKNNGKVIMSVIKRNNKAILKVEDTGIGIPKEHWHRVFERFYRVDKSHSKETGGTGLGLSIVKHVARYHNAKISLYSVVGKGTTIAVSFPL